MPNPTLRVKKTSYFEVDYNDLDTFINKVYGIKGFSCAATEEWGNDSQHRVYVEKKPLASYDAPKVEKNNILNADYNLRAIMQDLANRDLIEPGIYLINVCW